jgi:hypothetical protein
MNSFETISFTEVRDRAKAKLRELNSTMQDMYIDLSILDANRRILSRDNVCQKQSEPIDVCDFCAELPCDFKSLIVLTTFPIGEHNFPMVYSDYPFDAPKGVTIWNTKDRFLLENGIVRFPSDFEAQKIALFYEAYLTDAEGFPMLRLSHVDYYVWSVIQEMFEAKGDYKAAMYWERKKLANKKALIHNEQVEQYELNKSALKSTIYSIINQYQIGNLGYRQLWQ